MGGVPGAVLIPLVPLHHQSLLDWLSSAVYRWDRNWPAFVSAQEEYSLLVRGTERELVPEPERQGMGLLPNFPLASGMLTGKYKQNE